MTTTAPGTIALAPAPAMPLESYLKAPSVLLMGPSGTGKTDVLGELATHVRKLFVLITEPNGLESLLDSFARRQVDIAKLHFHIVEPARSGFQNMANLAKLVSLSTHESLSKQSPGSRQGAKFIEAMAACNSFTCHRTGENFGSIETLGADCAFALDSLSGLSTMAWDVTVGDKLTAHPGEWGIGMKLVEKSILALTSNLKCLFVLTAHIARETDEITQTTKVMVNTLGKKLAPDIPKFFSEVVLTSTENGQFFWNTIAPQADLKRRALPLAAKLPPSFGPIVEAYKKRLALVTTTK